MLQHLPAQALEEVVLESSAPGPGLFTFREQACSGFASARNNGPAFKSGIFLRFILAHPELLHVRTRYRAPHTNGVVERWTGTAKYEHLYRIDIPSGWALGEECEYERGIYNQVRPHESLAFGTPEQAHLASPSTPPRPVPGRFGGLVFGEPQPLPADPATGSESNLSQPETVQKT